MGKPRLKWRIYLIIKKKVMHMFENSSFCYSLYLNFLQAEYLFSSLSL